MNMTILDTLSYQSGYYLKHVIEKIKKKSDTNPTQTTPASPEELFNILMHHDFCYLSRSQATPYKAQIIEVFQSATQKKVPLPMYLDLGPGYHAALEVSDPRHLNFDVGLGELLVLYQIKKFHDRVREIYPPGADFSIIIDNICAVFVNDIAIPDTEEYCRRFRELIAQLNMEDRVRLLVESEHFTVSDYDVKPISQEAIKSTSLSEDQYHNVKRFLGHDCPIEEAIRRVLVYKQIGDRTDELFSNFFRDGVHMTQRASKSTICFRAFPGGDSRIQSGQVVLGINQRNKIYPFLMTSQNINDYTCESLSFPGLLPKAIQKITAAHRTHPFVEENPMC